MLMAPRTSVPSLNNFKNFLFSEVETDSLYDPQIIQSYLQLMMETSNPDTLEGLAGAIQNLTAGKCRFAAILRDAVRVEKGLPVIVDLLK